MKKKRAAISMHGPEEFWFGKGFVCLSFGGVDFVAEDLNDERKVALRIKRILNAHQRRIENRVRK